MSTAAPGATAVGDGRVALLLTLVWGDAVIPHVIQSLTTPKFRRSAEVDYGGYTAAAAAAQDVFRIAVVVTCTLLIVDSIRRRRPLHMYTLALFLAPWAYLVLRDLFAHSNPSTDTLLLPVICFALWAAAPPLSSLRVLAHLTTLAAVISISMAVLDPPSALFRSDQGVLIVEDKQIIPSGMLAGFLTQPNNLGQFIVLGLPAIVLLRRRRWAWVYFAICAFAIIWTASRTSIYALAIMCLTVALLWSARARQVRPALSIGMIAIPFTAVCCLPLLTSNPSSFSERGFIWQESLPAWYRNPLFGQGANWYRDLALTSNSIASSAFQGHNQLVQLLVTGGLLYAGLTAAMLVLASVTALRHAEHGADYGVIYLAALAGTCLLEVSLVTVDNYSMFPVVVVPLTIITFGQPIRPRLSFESTVPVRAVRAGSPTSAARFATVAVATGRPSGLGAARPRVLVPHHAGQPDQDPAGV